uniref:Ubiquitin-fold modifier 1 n=1 Tax=Rhizophora mucronata TaxID=61149 RepID=A0A2P2IYN6_RHIMU
MQRWFFDNFIMIPSCLHLHPCTGISILLANLVIIYDLMDAILMLSFLCLFFISETVIYDTRVASNGTLI